MKTPGTYCPRLRVVIIITAAHLSVIYCATAAMAAGAGHPAKNAATDGVLVNLSIAGLPDAKKLSPGGLAVRNYDNNSAPRAQITISLTGTHSSAWGGSVTVTANTSQTITLYDAAAGGNVVPLRSSFPASTLPKSLYVEGTTYSSQMRDVTVTATASSGATDKVNFTVLWVDRPTINCSHTQPSALDTARQKYIDVSFDQAGFFGPQFFNNGKRYGIGVEISAVVHPPTFSYPPNALQLSRVVIGEVYVVNPQGTVLKTVDTPPTPDTSRPSWQDDTPDANGKIYDLDTPGANIPERGGEAGDNAVGLRNYTECATITLAGSGVICSPIEYYYESLSITEQAVGNWGPTQDFVETLAEGILSSLTYPLNYSVIPLPGN